MFLLPYNTKINKGKTNVVALANITAKEEPLELHRIRLSTNQPVSIRVLAVKVDDLNGGEEITKFIADSHYTRPTPKIHKALFNAKGGRDFVVLKEELVFGTADVVDDKDGIILDTGTAVVLQVDAPIGMQVVGSFLWKQPERATG